MSMPPQPQQPPKPRMTWVDARGRYWRVQRSARAGSYPSTGRLSRHGSGSVPGRPAARRSRPPRTRTSPGNGLGRCNVAAVLAHPVIAVWLCCVQRRRSRLVSPADRSAGDGATRTISSGRTTRHYPSSPRQAQESRTPRLANWRGVSVVGADVWSALVTSAMLRIEVINTRK